MERLPLQLRLPEDIKDWARKKAKDNDRSMNSMIVRILRERMEQEAGASA